MPRPSVGKRCIASSFTKGSLERHFGVDDAYSEDELAATSAPCSARNKKEVATSASTTLACCHRCHPPCPYPHLVSRLSSTKASMDGMTELCRQSARLRHRRGPVRS